ncbi:hypothetical protein E2F46_06115 [Luteimonas aestuarii]|uniref:Lipoprotein n=1 Tax=Luteimonas aestuarii TaxID=453837 RepID=A0A4R5TYQ7_9GAMM|nr:DUF6491 family protein [Luteimonas aestuarii]TDK26355.1 hypothetical protein E2F46_06115 [Luteimonas aestuarii]
MKSILLAAVATAALSACATGGLRDAEKLDLYRTHAGDPVGSFNFFGRLNGWTPLGDSALAVWTRPNEAFLLELSGPCQDLPFATAIGLTSSAGRVHERFDRVLVRSTGSMNIPCFIRTIRPLDVKAVRMSERELREARTEEREAASD